MPRETEKVRNEGAIDPGQNPFPGIAGWLHILTHPNATESTIRQLAVGISDPEVGVLKSLIGDPNFVAARNHWIGDLAVPFRYNPPCPAPGSITKIAQFPFPFPGKTNHPRRKRNRAAKRR